MDLDAVEPRRLLVREQLLVSAEARLRLRVPRARREPHPLELSLQRALVRRCLLFLDCEPRLLLLQPARVVALVGDAPATVELEDPAGDVVEEVAVVRDGDDGALVLRKEALQPEHRLGVEMVRRLVEQQQVGRLQEQPAERDAPTLSARERADLTVAFREPQRVHRVVEMRLELPRVVEVRIRLGEGCRDRVEAVEQVAQLAHPVLDVLAHRLGIIELRLLLEQAHGGAGGELGDARGRLLLARHDPQERRLPRAVRPEHADLRPGQERERDVRQHLPVRSIELVCPVHREDVVAHAGQGNSDLTKP